MKLTTIKTQFLVWTLVCAFLSPLSISAQCYQQVWADEFNGSSLDRSKWTVITGEGGAVSGNAELQYYLDRSQNIQVADGSLKIIALNDGYASNAYTSARMQTKNLGDWKYGRFEARIKLPVGQGMWPAFWLLPTDSEYGVWPRSGEMDIMELIGREPSNAYATIHTHNNSGAVRSFGNVYTLSSGTFADDFHLFSMEWSPDLIKMYVDGNLYSTQTPATVAPNPWVFDKRFFILLNLAIGGAWAGAPNGTTTFPQTMEVDYVRVYQKIEDFAITGQTLVEPSTPSVNYSVPNVSGATYNWAVSGAGNSIASGQGSAQIAVNWGSQSGVVSVSINDGCAATVMPVANVTVSPNQWDNFGFERDFVNWDTRPAYSVAVNFSISNSDFTEGGKSAQVQVVTPQTDPWNIQLSRTNLNLVAGTAYTLRFKAKSDAARSIPIVFIRSSDFGGIAYQTINLTTNWQTFTLSFTPSATVNAMFNADLATAAGTYFFDDFTFARTALLPLDLVSFLGNTEGAKNVLKWQTENEINVAHFDIERSLDGHFFEKIGEIKANGKNSNYQFTDDLRLPTVTYYRLKINDLDGKFVFSKIIILENNKLSKCLKIYPNPVSDQLTVELPLNTEGVEIVNFLGQILFSQKAKGSLTIDMSRFTEGGYFLKSGGQTVRFVKK